MGRGGADPAQRTFAVLGELMNLCSQTGRVKRRGGDPGGGAACGISKKSGIFGHGQKARLRPTRVMWNNRYEKTVMIYKQTGT